MRNTKQNRRAVAESHIDDMDEAQVRETLCQCLCSLWEIHEHGLAQAVRSYCITAFKDAALPQAYNMGYRDGCSGEPARGMAEFQSEVGDRYLNGYEAAMRDGEQDANVYYHETDEV